MRKSRLSQTQLVGILKELKAGAKAAALCRKYGISETTLYNWHQALNIEALKIVAEGNF